MKRYKYNYGKNPEGALSTISGYATETTNFGETAFGILNKSTRDEENFTTPEVVSSSTATLFSVGNGTDHDSRKNIIELKADGTVYINGVGQYDGTNPGEATDIADEFQGIHDDIDDLNDHVDRIDNTIESIHIAKDENSDLIYTLLIDGENRGTINIPKDQFLRNVRYDNDTNELIFSFVTTENDNQEVRVNLTDLEDIYTSGDGINIDNKEVSVKIDADTQPYIIVTANGVKIVGVDEKFNTINQNVTDLTDRVTTAENDIDTLGTRIDTAENSIEAIQGDLEGLVGDGEGSVQDQINKALEDYLPLSGGTMTGNVEVVSDDSTASYMSSGVTISGKSDQDLLNAAGSTTTIDSIREGLATEDTLNEYKTSNDAEIAALKSKDTELSNKIDSIHIPSKVSELENDSKYQTEDQVNSKIQAVVGAAPEALDTLKEIGDALGNDPDFAATMTNKLTEINSKIGSNTYTGANYISKETNLTDAVVQLDEEIKATNDNLALEHANAEATYAKKTELSSYLPLSGGDVTGKIFSIYSIEVGRRSISESGTLYIPNSRINESGFSYYVDPYDSDTDAIFITGKRINNWNNWGGISPGMTIHTTDGLTRYQANGITIPNKTASDLLNAAGGTVSIQDIISQVTVPTKVSELTNDSGFQTEAQVAAKVSALVDSAPETLDTLNELAAALGDDPNFATTVTNQIASKQDKLVSGTNIKTINGQTLLGSGDITTPTPTVNAASGTKTIWTGTSSEYEAVPTKGANTLYFITEG